jgi:acetone carboxylase alpha subunit
MNADLTVTATPTALERLRTSEELMERTGSYQGLAELQARAADPIRYERLHARLLSAVIEAREMARRISGSPSVREMGEFLVTLFTAEGDAIALSTGIMLHVHTTSRFIKWMLENDYETEPGIAEGDVFCNNDPFIGDVQTADVMVVTPMFHEGVLIGWIGAVSHVPDVGGVEPGAEPSIVADRFGEGLFFCAEKIGSEDRIHKTHTIRCERNLRDPALFILDEKAKIAACFDVREKVGAIVAEYGLDYYQRANQEFIEEQRRGILARARTTLVPGRYRGIAHFAHLMADQRFVMPQVARDLLYAMPLSLTVEGDGTLVLDLEGTPEAGPHSSNCTPAGMAGGLLLALLQTLAYDGKVNHGAWAATRMSLPAGSLVNPIDEQTATSTGWAVLIPIFGTMTQLVARGFYMRGFVEEVFLGSACAGFQEWGGHDRRGARFGGSNFECGAVGSGARGVMDGIDTGYAIFNPEADMGSIETWEQQFPVLYLGRRNLPDSGGAGAHRGGVTFAPVIKAHRSDDILVGVKENSGRIFDQKGVFGGYPAADAHRHVIVRGSDFQERAERHEPLPHRMFDEDDGYQLVTHLSGEVEEGQGQLANAPLRHDDFLTHSYGSNGGFGDPLDRDPAAVVEDLHEGAVSLRAAGAVYGVEVDADGALDAAATERRRAEIRSERLRASRPATEWLEEQRARVRDEKLIEPVLEMYRSALAISDPFAAEFRQFWSLDKEWGTRA